MTLGEPTIIYSIGLLYLLAHFLIYVLKLRELPQFETERGIFFYHFTSAILFTTISLVIYAMVSNGPAFVSVLGLVAMHGIYSISFLELWSLAQGSYSISIVSGANQSREQLIAAYARIGDEKKSNRLSALVQMSLVQRTENSWQLTGRGRFFATLIAGLLWLVDIRKAG